MHDRFVFFVPVVAVGLAAACSTAFATEYGTVLSSTPVVQQVTVPRQDCADQQGYVQAPPTGGGALVGAVVGGLAGNAIGAGAGRALATGIGAVSGALVGNQVEASQAPVQPVTTTRCTYSRAVESRIVGYDVVYDFNGQQRSARVARDPGTRIALAVGPAADIVADPVPIDMQAAAQTAYPAYATDPAAYPGYGVPAYAPYPYDYPYGYGYVGPSIYFGGHYGWRGGRHR